MTVVMTRLIAILVVLSPVVGCTSKSLSPGERMAVESAKKWLVANGFNANDNALEVRIRETGWIVDAKSQPFLPGGHTTFYIDSEGKVTKIVPGA
jgi:hypothetical protein